WYSARRISTLGERPLAPASTGNAAFPKGLRSIIARLRPRAPRVYLHIVFASDLCKTSTHAPGWEGWLFDLSSRGQVTANVGRTWFRANREGKILSTVVHALPMAWGGA